MIRTEIETFLGAGVSLFGEGVEILKDGHGQRYKERLSPGNDSWEDDLLCLGWRLPVCPSLPAGVPAPPAPPCPPPGYWQEPRCPVPPQTLCEKTSGWYLAILQFQPGERLGPQPRGAEISL